MKHVAKTLALAALAILACAGAKGSVAIPTVRTSPRIDGTLDDPAWQHAAVVHLSYDLRDHRSATQQTTDYVMTDGRYLYVGVDARQTTPIRALQHTDNVGQDTDDEVQIDLWPNGPNGFQYAFFATPLGTHYQFGSENAIYQPTWWSAGKIVPGGFTVTMKIPLEVMHGTASGDWRVQFSRSIVSSNNDFVWSFGPAQQNHNDVNYAGAVNGLPRLAALRAKPRIGLYGLTAAASPASGGNALRNGADVSIPVVPGTSFFAALHPDFSNVELDQQTIAPTAFVRTVNEVRPFFTQGQSVYQSSPYCIGCNGLSEIYTPNIPTPRDGYAIEGQRGLFSYGGFDAVGTGRDDTAQAVNYISPNRENTVNWHRTSVDLPSMHDDLDGFTITHDNLSDFFTYARYSTENRTGVNANAQRYELGGGLYDPNGWIYAVVRKLGDGYDPMDGLIPHTGIAGYDVNFSQTFKYSSTAALKEFTVVGFADRYHASSGALNQSDSGFMLSATTRRLLNVQLSGGSSYLLLPNGVFSPVSQNGAQVTYDYQSAFPTTLSFNTGRFGDGRLNAWARSSTMRMGQRGSLTLEADDTQQILDSGLRQTQWLERASFAYQSGHDRSFALGVRRIIGTPPLLGTAQPFENAWNLSAAYYEKFGSGELYIVYGDSAATSTVPQVLVKFIRYLGAGKGS